MEKTEMTSQGRTRVDTKRTTSRGNAYTEQSRFQRTASDNSSTKWATKTSVQKKPQEERRHQGSGAPRPPSIQVSKNRTESLQERSAQGGRLPGGSREGSKPSRKTEKSIPMVNFLFHTNDTWKCSTCSRMYQERYRDRYNYTCPDCPPPDGQAVYFVRNRNWISPGYAQSVKRTGTRKSYHGTLSRAIIRERSQRKARISTE